MDRLNIGANCSYIIQEAMKCKTLKTLGLEEDAYQASKIPKPQPKVNLYPQRPVRILYRLEDDFPIRTKQNMQKMREQLKDKSPEEILRAAGMHIIDRPYGQGKYLTSFGAPTPYCSWSELGVNEEDLIKGIKKIGSCNLESSSLRNLGSVEEVSKLTIPLFSKLEDLSSLKEVRSVYLDASDAKFVKEALEKLNLRCPVSSINGVDVASTGSTKEALRSFMASGAYESTLKNIL